MILQIKRRKEPPKNAQKESKTDAAYPEVDHPHAMELRLIGRILDDIPTIHEVAWQDLTRNVENFGTGAEGMSAEQVVRCAIVKQMEGYSYDELAFHIVDSSCYRSFCRIGIAHKGFKKSALCDNIKALSATTWEAINRILVAYAQDKKIEKRDVTNHL